MKILRSFLAALVIIFVLIQTLPVEAGSIKQNKQYYGARIELTNSSIQSAVSYAANSNIEWLTLELDWDEITSQPQNGGNNADLSAFFTRSRPCSFVFGVLIFPDAVGQHNLRSSSDMLFHLSRMPAGFKPSSFCHFSHR